MRDFPQFHVEPRILDRAARVLAEAAAGPEEDWRPDPLASALGTLLLARRVEAAAGALGRVESDRAQALSAALAREATELLALSRDWGDTDRRVVVGLRTEVPR